MIPPNLLGTKVSVKRRTSTGRDSLNNPIYGTPTSGVGWRTIYDCVPCRLAFNTKSINFANEGERIQPTGTMYYNTGYNIEQADRILTENGIEYEVRSVVPARTFGKSIDHYEILLILP